ncbi:hypothetical protein ACQCVK_22245 [Rossellomorea vietnamensis]|uniref:hypothetical protein n=1 Tax=Rossellomorea vietnamensis TaxID=218284 RepID=UPI003CF04696
MNEESLLYSLLFPREYSYEMSEKLFLDIWKRRGSPSEINEGSEIFEFLNEIIEASNGLVILDHFSHVNYDNIHSIKYEKPYTKIIWKDFNDYRKKYLEQTLSEDEKMVWDVNGYATYMYMFLHISKIKVVQLDNHLFILFLLNLIPPKSAKKLLIPQENELISDEVYKDSLYREYTFWEGDKEEAIKHICIVNNLPYYTCLIQPKENCSHTEFSKFILLNETLNEISERMDRVQSKLVTIEEHESDELFAQGNTIRRILEYSLKFLCLYKEIDLKIDEKYGYVSLGDLKKEINKSYGELGLTQNIVNMANELSHDSGEVFNKEEIFKFWKDVKNLLDKVNEKILEK